MAVKLTHWRKCDRHNAFCVVRRVMLLKTAVIGRLNPAKQGLKIRYSRCSTTPVLCAHLKVCYIIYECLSAVFLTCYMFAALVRQKSL